MPNNLIKLMEHWDIEPKDIIRDTGIIGSRVTNLKDFAQSKLNRKIYAWELEALESLFPETCTCHNCDNTFPSRDLKTYKEYDMGHIYHSHDYCPHCGSEDYEYLRIKE
jgi:hypothetical protein